MIWKFPTLRSWFDNGSGSPSISTRTSRFTNSELANRELFKRPNQHQEFDRPSVDVSVNDGSVFLRADHEFRRKAKQMSEKQQLIEMLIPALVKSTATTAEEVRAVLETYQLDGLKKELARQRKAGYLRGPEDVANDPEIMRKVEAIRAEVRRQAEKDPERLRQQRQQDREMQETLRSYALAQVFRVQLLIEGKSHVAIQNTASERIIESWLHPGETLTAEWFVRVIRENPTLATQLPWKQVLTPEEQKQHQAKQRKIFNNAAKSLRTFGTSEANFELIRSTLGGFSEHSIEQALTSNALQLSPPTQDDLDDWAAEDIETNNESLLKAGPAELRARVRQESADKRLIRRQQTRTRVSRLQSSAIRFQDF